jgi:hypothetical protein
MNFDLRPLLSPSYWFTLNPPAVWQGAGRSLVVIFLGMVVASIVIRRMKLPRAKDRYQAAMYRRLADMLSTMGGVGVALFFFSFQQIRLLGARPLYVLWVIGLIVWIALIVRYVKKIAPADRAREIERREKEKYLPGRRK